MRTHWKGILDNRVIHHVVCVYHGMTCSHQICANNAMNAALKIVFGDEEMGTLTDDMRPD